MEINHDAVTTPDMSTSDVYLACAQGRDSQRNLQRSMAARRWQESMPALLTWVAAAADQWAAAANQLPFLLNGRHLKVQFSCHGMR